MDLIVAFLIGMVVGAGAISSAALACLDECRRVKAAEEQVGDGIWKTLVFLAMAQNAKLKVSLAASEMTEEGKTLAAMTVAALNAVIAADIAVLEERKSRPA